jgi:DNA-binding transcriptional regulator YdaS (Cro superfamily)
MKSVRVIAGLLIVCLSVASTAWSATLTWTANSETDLSGYRVYNCSVSNCSRTSGTAGLLATLGRVTSFNIGTPATTQYYFVTAFDYSNNESQASSLVTYTPATSVPPAIGVSPTSVSFAATQGGANPATQTLAISNTGGGTLSWTASESATWLALSQTAGTGNSSVTLSATTGTLASGTYNATITISATGAASVTVPVTLTVSSTSVPVVGASPTSFSFVATQGGANPATQSLRISNAGGGTLDWFAAENANWLSLSPAFGLGTANVTLSVTTGTLAAGTYSSMITIGATGASSVNVPVTFTVTSGTSTTPAIGVSPTSLSFTARQGGANPASQTLQISNTGGGTLTWSARDNAGWFSLSPLDGSGNATITLNVVTAGLLAGTYSGNITIGAAGISTIVNVPVTLTITP